MADHKRILAAALEWRGTKMALATVTQTWRSAPCPVGTHMLVREGGDFVGSVSGGCVEGDILTLANEVIDGAPHALRHYGVANTQAWEAGLPCGGDIAVLVQPVSDAGFAAVLFEEITQAQAAGQTLLIGTDLESGLSRVVADAGDAAFVNLYAPPKRLLIIGAVEIAASLSSIAGQLGISVTVIDPRAHFLTQARFPGVALDDRWPDVAVAANAPDSRTAVVTLSHDPKIDDPALIAALASPAAYIGALGSRASHSARRVRLIDAGVDAAGFARVEGPAGVSINSVNASEIALSIAAAVVRSFNDGLR
ncbi:MAG: XdhC family protein [Pseudomonadota bacterium]